MQLKENAENIASHIALLFSQQYYFYFQMDHFKRNVYTSLVFRVRSRKYVNTSFLLSE